MNTFCLFQNFPCSQRKQLESDPHWWTIRSSVKCLEDLRCTVCSSESVLKGKPFSYLYSFTKQRRNTERTSTLIYAVIKIARISRFIPLWRGKFISFHRLELVGFRGAEFHNWHNGGTSPQDSICTKPHSLFLGIKGMLFFSNVLWSSRYFTSNNIYIEIINHVT